MKTYTVTAKYTTYLRAEIEAENEDEAYLIAREMDGASFDVQETDDWEILDVEPTHP